MNDFFKTHFYRKDKRFTKRSRASFNNSNKIPNLIKLEGCLSLEVDLLCRELSNSTGPMDELDYSGEIMDVDGVMINKWNSEAKVTFLF